MESIAIDFSSVEQAQNEVSQKVIQKLTKSILKKARMAETTSRSKFSLKSMKNVREIYELAAYLFVFENYDLCYDVCCILDGVSFTGDYGVWDFVAKCRTMKSAIDRMHRREGKAQQSIESILPYEASELYEGAWESKKKIANDLAKQYLEAKEGKRTASVVRYSALGICLSCNHYIQLNALAQYHSVMKEWQERLSEFLRAEEQ